MPETMWLQPENVYGGSSVVMGEEPKRQHAIHAGGDG